KLLLRFDILTANFDNARRRIAALPESEAYFGAAYEASIAFLTGDNVAALAGFRNALKLLRKSLGKRKVALEAEAGLFHMLALLRTDDPALRTDLLSLLEAAMTNVTPFFPAHRAIAALLDLIEGRQEQAQQSVKHLLAQNVLNPTANTMVSLAALFIDVALMREQDREGRDVMARARCRVGAGKSDRVHGNHLLQTALGARVRYADDIPEAR
ncbi:MAG: hypothetical protein P8Y36_04675, partial [Alphaproteobacteria bacterium]